MSELKLLQVVELRFSWIITATCTVTAKLSRICYDDFVSGNKQSANNKLCDVRTIFDRYNLISVVHTYYSREDKIYKNILPHLSLLSKNEEKDLIDRLKDINFSNKSSLAA